MRISKSTTLFYSWRDDFSPEVIKIIRTSSLHNNIILGNIIPCFPNDNLHRTAFFHGFLKTFLTIYIPFCKSLLLNMILNKFNHYCSLKQVQSFVCYNIFTLKHYSIKNKCYITLCRGYDSLKLKENLSCDILNALAIISSLD